MTPEPPVGTIPTARTSLLPRVLEPEVMDTEEEAHDYDAMDHSAVNARFCDDLLSQLSPDARARRVLDVGTGTALIPIELARRAPEATIVALDLAEHMLALARRNVELAGLGGRIELARRDAKSAGYPPGSFDVVMSNSIVHHIPDPSRVLAEMWVLTAEGGLLFVRDLLRPETESRVRALVDAYADVDPALEGAERARAERQRALFEASLRASLTPAEVEALVAPLGIAETCVQVTSDRHWTLAARKPKRIGG
jgi:ubiquinone/menaquinone biosynthesis C-methylase UbiE